MSLGQHIAELRNRLVFALLGIFVGAIGGWFLFDPVFRELQQPLLDAAARSDGLVSVNFAGIASALDMRIKVSAFLGVVISSPWWLYQVWAFIAPGLTGREKKWTLGFLGASVPLFLLGIGTSWLVFPQAVDILIGFSPDDSAQLLDAQLYLGFAMRLLLAFGLAFVFPVVMVALSWMGIVPVKAWLKGWRWAILVIVIFTAIMTPSPDAVSMIVMSIPMVGLYFGAIGVAALRRPTPQEIE